MTVGGREWNEGEWSEGGRVVLDAWMRRVHGCAVHAAGARCGDLSVDTMERVVISLLLGAVCIAWCGAKDIETYMAERRLLMAKVLGVKGLEWNADVWRGEHH